MILLNEKLKASDFFFLDKDFNQMFPLRNYINFSWHPTFNESFGGDFEIEFDISTNEKERLTRLIEVGYHIASLPNQKIGVVTSIEESKFKDGERTLIVSGIMMDGLLQNRYAPSNVMDNIVQHGSVIDYSLMLMMVAADWDRYNAIMKTRPYAKHYNKNNYAETLGWGDGSWMANKLNMVNFPVYVDFHMADTSFSYGALDTTSLDSQSSNIGALVSKYTRENTTGTGVFPLFKERDYLYNDTDKEKPIQLLKEGAYDKENITMFVYNGKDLSDSIIFTDQNGSLDRLIKLNTNKQVENNTMFQYSYKSRGPNRYEDGRVNYDTLDIKDSFLIPSSAFVDGKDNILVKEVLDAKTFSENSGDLEYKKISQENQQFFESNYNLNSEINNSIEANISEFYEASLNTNIFVPGRDFSLGDFVTVESQEMGVSSIMLVSGLIYFFDSNGQESVEVELEDYSKFDNHNLILDVKYEDSKVGVEGVEFGIFKGNTLMETIIVNSAGMAYGAKNLEEGNYTVRMTDSKGLVFRISGKLPVNRPFTVKGSRRPTRMSYVIEDYQLEIYIKPQEGVTVEMFFGTKGKSNGPFLKHLRNLEFTNSNTKYNFRFMDSRVDYAVMIKDTKVPEGNTTQFDYKKYWSAKFTDKLGGPMRNANIHPGLGGNAERYTYKINITNSSLFNNSDSLNAPLAFSVPLDMETNTGIKLLNQTDKFMDYRTKNEVEISLYTTHALRYSNIINVDAIYDSGELYHVKNFDHTRYANIFGRNNIKEGVSISDIQFPKITHWTSYGVLYESNSLINEFIIDVPTKRETPNLSYANIPVVKKPSTGLDEDVDMYLSPFVKAGEEKDINGWIDLNIPESAELLRTEIGTLDPLNITRIVRFVEFNPNSENFNSFRNIIFSSIKEYVPATYSSLGFCIYSKSYGGWITLNNNALVSVKSSQIFRFNSRDIFTGDVINEWMEKIIDVSYLIREDLVLSPSIFGGAYITPTFIPWWKPGETPSL